jgi:DNA-binding phage protein
MFLQHRRRLLNVSNLNRSMRESTIPLAATIFAVRTAMGFSLSYSSISYILACKYMVK